MKTWAGIEVWTTLGRIALIHSGNVGGSSSSVGTGGRGRGSSSGRGRSRSRSHGRGRDRGRSSGVRSNAKST